MSCPENDVRRVREALDVFARELSRALAPAAKAMAAFGEELHRLVAARLAARGLTWGQVAHLPPDQLAAVVWGGADLPDVPVEVKS